MPIQAAYDIGDKIYYIKKYKLRTAVVASARIEASSDYRKAQYLLEGEWVDEEHTSDNPITILDKLLNVKP